MSIFETIGKLRGFLSKKNLELLDTIFEGLTENHDVSRPFWQWFSTQKGWDGVEFAITQLIELRAILTDYRKTRG